MTRCTLSSLWIVPVLATGLATRAAVLSGNYTTNFGGNLGLWDVSGSYSQQLGGLGEIHYAITADGGGNVLGAGTIRFRKDGPGPGSAGMDGTLSVRGTARSAGSALRVNLGMRADGTGYWFPAGGTCKGRVQETLELDRANLELIGFGSGELNFKLDSLIAPDVFDYKTARIPRFEVQAPLPARAGEWKLVLMNLSTNGNRYTGSAAIVLASGRSLPLDLHGTYERRSGISRLTLSGEGTNQRVSLSLAIRSANQGITVLRMSGRVLGQTLRLTPDH